MQLHTVIKGNGEPVVFLHTGLQTGEIDFADHCKHFQEDFQVILPDLRGHGKSVCENMNRNTYFEDAVNDLAETFDVLALQSAHIAGVSLGAIVGLMFAKKFPERVKSLALSGILPKKPADYNKIQMRERETQKFILQDKEAAAYFDQMHRADWRNILAFALEVDWYPFHETGDVAKIECPSIVIVGEQLDHEVQGALYYKRMNENFQMTVVPAAAHLVHREQPELYTKIVEVFIRGVMDED